MLTFLLIYPRVCQRNHWPNHKGLCRPNTENVGLPFLVSVPESRLCYARLTQLLEDYSRYTVQLSVLGAHNHLKYDMTHTCNY